MNPASGTDNAAPRSPLRARRRGLFIAATLAAGFALLWGAPEILVRALGAEVAPYRGIIFGPDRAASLALFMKDPRLHWKMRPGAEAEFLGKRVRIGPEGFRGEAPAGADGAILCLGDSTTFGWGVGDAETFAAQLEARLSGRAYLGKVWRAANAGVPSYSSFQTRLAAERLIPKVKPELVVLCIGNNDCMPVETPDAELDARRRGRTRLLEVLYKSRALLWAADRLSPGAPRAFETAPMPGARRRVSESEHEANVRATIALAREAGAPTLVLAPAVNLMEPALGIEGLLDWKKWGAWYKEIEALFAEGKFEEALGKIEAQPAGEAEAFFPMWAKGFALARMGRGEEAREALERSIELQPFPERAPRALRAAARRAAEAERAVFLDLNEILDRAAAPGGRERFFLDNVHPTPEGHAIIAEALAKVLEAIAGEGAGKKAGGEKEKE